jgi:hypothetical protein
MRKERPRRARRQRLPDDDLDEVLEDAEDTTNRHQRDTSFFLGVRIAGSKTYHYAFIVLLASIAAAAGTYVLLVGLREWPPAAPPLQAQDSNAASYRSRLPPPPRPPPPALPATLESPRRNHPAPLPLKLERPPPPSPPSPPSPPPPPYPFPPQQSSPPPTPPPATWQEIGGHNCWWDGHGVGAYPPSQLT